MRNDNYFTSTLLLLYYLHRSSQPDKEQKRLQYLPGDISTYPRDIRLDSIFGTPDPTVYPVFRHCGFFNRLFFGPSYFKPLISVVFNEPQNAPNLLQIQLDGLSGREEVTWQKCRNNEIGLYLNSFLIQCQRKSLLDCCMDTFMQN